MLRERLMFFMQDLTAEMTISLLEDVIRRCSTITDLALGTTSLKTRYIG